jgi:hypothetical protein
VGVAVVGDEVESGGITEAMAVLVDDGWEAEAGAVVADGDGGVAQVAGGFEALVVVVEGVVGADFAGAFEEEEFVVVGVVVEAADEVEVEAEAVDGFHAEGAVFAGVVGGFDPLGELVVELVEVVDVAEIADEELVADGAKEAFDFAFGGTISDGGVDEDGAEPRADEAKFFGGVVGTVVDVDGFGDAAFVEGGLEAFEEVGGVICGVKGAVGDDAGGVVDEADEEGFGGVAFVAVGEVGAVHGVGLPEVVGVGFGEGEAGFGCCRITGLEEIEAVDDAAKGVGGDLGALEEATVDAGAVDFGDVVFFAVKAGHDLFDGFEELFGDDFAGGALVGAGGGICNAVFAVVVPPALDGAPGEAAELSVFIEEGHLADGLVAGDVGGAAGVFECSEDSHFEVVGDALHSAGNARGRVARGVIALLCCY